MEESLEGFALGRLHLLVGLELLDPTLLEYEHPILLLESAVRIVEQNDQLAFRLFLPQHLLQQRLVRRVQGLKDLIQQVNLSLGTQHPGQGDLV